MRFYPELKILPALLGSLRLAPLLILQGEDFRCSTGRPLPEITLEEQPQFRQLLFVLIMITHPILRKVRSFVAAFGGQIEEVVGGVQQIDAARIS